MMTEKFLNEQYWGLTRDPWIPNQVRDDKPGARASLNRMEAGPKFRSGALAGTGMACLQNGRSMGLPVRMLQKKPHHFGAGIRPPGIGVRTLGAAT